MRQYAYDAAGRVRTLRDKTGAGVLVHQRTLDYDALDRVTKETVTPEPAAYSVPLPAAMTYDNDDRLSGWNGQTAASDPDGNLTTGPVGGAMVSLTYDARNRLTAVAGNGLRLRRGEPAGEPDQRGVSPATYMIPGGFNVTVVDS